METFTFNGKRHNVFTIPNFGAESQVIVVPSRYQNNDTLALQILDITKDENQNFGFPSPFGRLTTNTPESNGFTPESNKAVVKNYSENESWWKELADKIGRDTGDRVTVGRGISLPVYEFELDKIYADK